MNLHLLPLLFHSPPLWPGRSELLFLWLPEAFFLGILGNLHVFQEISSSSLEIVSGQMSS